jgi:hypothetical protein
MKNMKLITETWKRFLNEVLEDKQDPIDLIDEFSNTREINRENVKSLYNKLLNIFNSKDLFEKYFAPGPYQDIDYLRKRLIEILEEDVGGIANNVDQENINYNPFTELRKILVGLRQNKAKQEVPGEIKEKLSELLNMLKTDLGQDFFKLQSRAISVIDVVIDLIKNNKSIDTKLKDLYTKRLGEIKNYILVSNSQEEFIGKSVQSLRLFDNIDYPENYGALDKANTGADKFLKKISNLLRSNIDYFNYNTSKLESLLRNVKDAIDKLPEQLKNLVDKLSVFLNKLISIFKGIETYKIEASKNPELKGKSKEYVVKIYKEAISKFKEENKDVYEIASKVLGELEGYRLMSPPGPARSPFDPPESTQPSPPPLARGYGDVPVAVAESKKKKK